MCYIVGEGEFFVILWVVVCVCIEVGVVWFVVNGWLLYGFVVLVWLMNLVIWEVFDGLLLCYMIML